MLPQCQVDVQTEVGRAKFSGRSHATQDREDNRESHRFRSTGADGERDCAACFTRARAGKHSISPAIQNRGGDCKSNLLWNIGPDRERDCAACSTRAHAGKHPIS
jgi:hypothetical protein